MTGDGWPVPGGGWWVTGGGWRVAGDGWKPKPRKENNYNFNVYVLATRLQINVLCCFVLPTYADYFYFLKYEKRQRNHACDIFFFAK